MVAQREHGESAGADRLFEELRALLDAGAIRAESYFRTQRQSDAGVTTDECTWCPLCTALGLVRGNRPELAEQLAEIVGAVRDVLCEQHRTSTTTAPGSTASEQPPSEGEAAFEREAGSTPEDASGGKVEHIDVRRVAGSILPDSNSSAGPETELRC